MTTGHDTSYQGYANFSTWCVTLWLHQDPDTYRRLQDTAAATVKVFLAEAPHTHPDTRSYRDLLPSEQFVIQYRLADQIQAFVETITPDLGETFAADLLTWAVAQTDWREVATGCLEALDG